MQKELYTIEESKKHQKEILFKLVEDILIIFDGVFGDYRELLRDMILELTEDLRKNGYQIDVELLKTYLLDMNLNALLQKLIECLHGTTLERISVNMFCLDTEFDEKEERKQEEK